MIYVGIVDLLQVPICHLKNEIHNFFKVNRNQNQIFTLILLSLGSDHQTFSMSLPTRLRDYYDKVVTPAADSGIHESFYAIYIELQ